MKTFLSKSVKFDKNKLIKYKFTDHYFNFNFLKILIIFFMYLNIFTLLSVQGEIQILQISPYKNYGDAKKERKKKRKKSKNIKKNAYRSSEIRSN